MNTDGGNCRFGGDAGAGNFLTDKEVALGGFEGSNLSGARSQVADSFGTAKEDTGTEHKEEVAGGVEFLNTVVTSVSHVDVTLRRAAGSVDCILCGS
ncbi:MAG TPA: hypothetical protein VGO13_12800 [Solirubrobacterales bacterium]|nr:hypothetical protein [Solirubrobacterales bacterium]